MEINNNIFQNTIDYNTFQYILNYYTQHYSFTLNKKLKYTYENNKYYIQPGEGNKYILENLEIEPTKIISKIDNNFDLIVSSVPQCDEYHEKSGIESKLLRIFVFLSKMMTYEET